MIFADYIKAFLVGGSICLVGQLLIDFTKLTPARILVSFVVIGVLLDGIGVYQPLIDFSGAGAAVSSATTSIFSVSIVLKSSCYFL